MATVTSLREEADRAAHAALCALTDLTTLAARAVTVDDALYVHRRAADLYETATGAIDRALETADTILSRR